MTRFRLGFVLLSVLLVAVLVGCRRTAGGKASLPQEDLRAKQMLQGIWLNDAEGDVSFMAKGDTIFYPDSTSQPVRFAIYGDTLVLSAAGESKYPIVKQAPHLFVFKNQNGDVVKLVKSEDPDDRYAFEERRPVALNQNRLIKRDTVVTLGGEKYHSYTQVNPTTYKVVKSSYNDDGVAVDNVYHDNIVHVSVFNGARKVYSGDFRKQAFVRLVPADYLSQSVLSDITFTRIDAPASTMRPRSASPTVPAASSSNCSSRPPAGSPCAWPTTETGRAASRGCGRCPMAERPHSHKRKRASRPES